MALVKGHKTTDTDLRHFQFCTSLEHCRNRRDDVMKVLLKKAFPW